MKRIIFAVMLLPMLVACHKSLEDRAASECKEYTEKKCPTPVVNNTRMDSMVFEASSRTIHYYYSLLGPADDERAIARQRSSLRMTVGEALKADPGTKVYKDAGFSFRYIYRSGKNPSKILLDETYTQKDFQH
ncbi:MAG: hypothetical protein K6A82_02985 [Prevotella sp.]|nr:hypothetical protein [Prevotella sp.]